MKYTYHLQVLDREVWHSISGGEVPKLYGEGYLDRHRHSDGPRLAMRLVRRDAHGWEAEVGHVPELADVSIGMVAGFPTSMQYLMAAARGVRAALRARELREEYRTPLEGIFAELEAYARGLL